MRRSIYVALGSSIAFGVVLSGTRAAPVARPPLEVWGVAAGDSVAIDGHAQTVKGGPLARAFVGEPFIANAPVVQELGAGKHDVVVEHAGCTPRRFSVEVQGAYKRSIVVAPVTSEHCAIPAPPPRAP